MKNPIAILEEIKNLTQFDSVIKNNLMLSYNKTLSPIARYEIIENKLFAVQLNLSYTEIRSFTEFRVKEFNRKNGTNIELIFEFVENR